MCENILKLSGSHIESQSNAMHKKAIEIGICNFATLLISTFVIPAAIIRIVVSKKERQIKGQRLDRLQMRLRQKGKVHLCPSSPCYYAGYNQQRSEKF